MPEPKTNISGWTFQAYLEEELAIHQNDGSGRGPMEARIQLVGEASDSSYQILAVERDFILAKFGPRGYAIPLDKILMFEVCL